MASQVLFPSNGTTPGLNAWRPIAVYESRAIDQYSHGWVVCPTSTVAGQTFMGNALGQDRHPIVHVGDRRRNLGPGIPAGAYVTAVPPLGTVRQGGHVVPAIRISAASGAGAGAGMLTLTSDVMYFTDNGIRANFTDQNSIVYGGSCYSQTLYQNNFAGAGYTGAGTGTGVGDEPDYVDNATKYGANGFDLGTNNVPAEDYFGVVHSVPMCAQTVNVKQFFGRLAGIMNNGDARWATVDFAKDTWTKDCGINVENCGLKHDNQCAAVAVCLLLNPALPKVNPAAPVYTHHGATPTITEPGCPSPVVHLGVTPGCDSDLSPSVMTHVPKSGAEIFAKVTPGKVIFDTLMNILVAPATVVTVTKPGPCGATITNQTWVKDGGPAPKYDEVAFNLNLKPIQGGYVTLEVNAPNAQAAIPNRSLLDGDLNPPHTDHVGPNQDSYTWKIACFDDSPLQVGDAEWGLMAVHVAYRWRSRLAGAEHPIHVV